MKPPPFEYHRPGSLQEALTLAASLDNAKIIAGGQSLMPMLNLRLIQPEHLIDIHAIPDLAGISGGDGVTTIGATTRQRDIEFSQAIRQRLPLMSEAILSVGHRQTRNRGTIGGSLCHLDPSAEMPLVAVAHDARMLIAGTQGQREVGVGDFCTGFMTPDVASDEILVGLRITEWPRPHGSAFVEYARRDGDFAIAAAAVLLATAADGSIARVSIALGGVAPCPLRVPAAEAVLLGQRPSESRMREAAACCAQAASMDDPNVPGWYRRNLAAELSFRAIKTALSRVGP
jgi:carbon-monoxide dehydrogenase medium subunit